MVKIETSDFDRLKQIDEFNRTPDIYQRERGYNDKSKEQELRAMYRTVEEKLEAFRGSVEGKIGVRLRKSQITTARSRDPKRIQPWIWYSCYYRDDDIPVGSAASLQFSIGPDRLSTASVWFEKAADDRKLFVSALAELVQSHDRKMLGWIEPSNGNSTGEPPIYYKKLESAESISEFGQLLLNPQNKGGVMLVLSPTEAEAAGENIEKIVSEDMSWMQKNIYLPTFNKGMLEASGQAAEVVKNVEAQNIPPMNTILFGPPGTGKTYHTKGFAVNLILKLVKSGPKAPQDMEVLENILQRLKEKEGELKGRLKPKLGQDDGPFIWIETKNKKYIYGAWFYKKPGQNMLIYLQVWPHAKKTDDERLGFFNANESEITDILGLKPMKIEKRAAGKTEIAIFDYQKDASKISAEDIGQITDRLFKLDKWVNEKTLG